MFLFTDSVGILENHNCCKTNLFFDKHYQDLWDFSLDIKYFKMFIHTCNLSCDDLQLILQLKTNYKTMTQKKKWKFMLAIFYSKLNHDLLLGELKHPVQRFKHLIYRFKNLYIFIVVSKPAHKIVEEIDQ